MLVSWKVARIPYATHELFGGQDQLMVANLGGHFDGLKWHKVNHIMSAKTMFSKKR